MEIHEMNMMVHLLLIFWIKKKTEKEMELQNLWITEGNSGCEGIGIFLTSPLDSQEQ